ncbi:hypothetical protein G7009_02855 [Pseudomonas capeferrum]|uniref:hypothetical protein n=1 Tax=Pseudomonas capeferrum TaxID=1495066 RepID=UPI0015E36247|nr:hypothetical protein [Pseudomonas capeferrum]MBA1200729.1 hypothetical protein [Pseudomonas capeferrum]
MSFLSVYHQSSPSVPNKVLTHRDDIIATLAECGVRFERCRAEAAIQPGDDSEAVIDACREQLDRLMTERGLAAVKVISIGGAQAQPLEFGDEHLHTGEEVCWFVAGNGQVVVRNDESFFAVLCDKHDLVVIPGGMRRWFDLGEQAQCVAIRLFKDEQGARPTYTGDLIPRQLPRFDD